jgi:hypothetical protein
MTRTLRPLLLALVLVGSVGGKEGTAPRALLPISGSRDGLLPECIGLPAYPWPSPLTIYVRRGVPVRVVEVDP